MNDEAVLIAVLAGLVLAGYVVEWAVRRERGEKVPLGQDPLRVLGVALGRVWRQRGLLLALMGFFVAAELVQQFVTDPLLNEPQLQRMGMARTPKPVGQGLAEHWEEVTAGDGWSQAVHYSVPRLWLLAVHRQDALVITALCLAMAMLFRRLRREQPEWLGETRRLPLGLFAGLNAAVVVVLFALRLWGMRYDSYPTMPLVLEILSYVALALTLTAAVPLTATVWQALLQVVRGGTCSCALAVRTALRVWKPALWYVLLVFSPMFLLPLLGRVALVWPSVWAVLSGWYLPFVLLFVPLVIVDRRVGLWQAVGRHFDVVGDNALEVLMFATRVVALMLPVQLLLEVTRFGATAGWFEGVRDVVGQAVGVLVAVWVAGWFAVYRYGEERWLEGEA